MSDPSSRPQIGINIQYVYNLSDAREKPRKATIQGRAKKCLAGEISKTNSINQTAVKTEASNTYCIFDELKDCNAQKLYWENTGSWLYWPGNMKNAQKLIGVGFIPSTPKYAI